MNLRLDCEFGTAFAPENFFFGVANAPYLSEGGYNTPAGPQNNYGYFERDGRVPVSGAATRFWSEYKQHIELAASLGLNAFRLGLDWSRVQPATTLAPAKPPAWDPRALDRYADMISCVRSHRMQPIVTLHHFTHPAWLGESIWLGDEGPDLLVDYELRVVEEVNDRLSEAGVEVMDHFITFNELNLVPLIYFVGPLRSTSAPDQASLAPAYDNILSRHIRIYDGLHDLFARKGWPTPRVGFGTASAIEYEHDRLFLDIARLRSSGVRRERTGEWLARQREAWDTRMDALARAKLTDEQYAAYRQQRQLAAAAIRPEMLTKTLEALYASDRDEKLDYLSVNVYEPLGPAKSEGDPRKRPKWWEFDVDTDVYHTFIHAYNDGNTGLPLYLGENSLALRQAPGAPAQPRADGWNRERYLKAYLMVAVRALAEGVPIHGYLYWSLTDDFEWEAGYEPRLGLYGYDYGTGTIAETDALGEPAGPVYAELITALRSGDKARIAATFTRRHELGVA